jgi:surface polysaccharide O-acyltransferase-like enzyme
MTPESVDRRRSTAVTLAPAPGRARTELAADVYQHNWDRLRLIGCLDILGSHLTGTHLFGGIGLPMFFLIAIALPLRRAQPMTALELAHQRGRRVLVPWLFWSACIALEQAARALARGEPAWGWVEPVMLLYGPEIHLWFLPFSVTAAVLVQALARATCDQPGRLLAWLGFALGFATLTLCPRFAVGWPFEQWGFSLPAICLGLALGRLIAKPSPASDARLELTLLAAAFALIALLLREAVPSTAPYVVRHVLGLALVVAALWLPNRPDPITRAVTPCLLGVYVLHLLVYRELIEPVVNALSLGLSAWQKIALTFGAALAIVELLRRTPLRRVL